VQDDLICPLQPGCGYIALSYVWGGVGPCLETGTEETKASERSLVSGTDSHLPQDLLKTLRDAIELTRLLGERYLWIDALCISQDVETRSAQIANMSRIYENALLTIVAAGGSDADAGLCGLSAVREKSESSAYYKLNASVDGVLIAVTTPIPTSSLLSSKWNTRGWTFQERLFSNRQLIFTGGQVFWNCKSAILFEDAPLQPKSSYNVDRFLDTIVRRFSVTNGSMALPTPPITQPGAWLDELVSTIQE
jgi:hypothetical protein